MPFVIAPSVVIVSADMLIALADDVMDYMHRLALVDKSSYPYPHEMAKASLDVCRRRLDFRAASRWLLLIKTQRLLSPEPSDAVVHRLLFLPASVLAVTVIGFKLSL